MYEQNIHKALIAEPDIVSAQRVGSGSRHF